MLRHCVGKIIAASTTVALTLVTLTSLKFLRVVGVLLLCCLSVSAAQADSKVIVASLRGVWPHLLVTGPGAPAVASIDDLGGRQLVVRKSSSYYEHLLGLNDRLQKEGKPTIELKAADAGLEDEDLLEMIGAGLLPWTVVDLHVANVWAKIYKNLIVHSNLVVHDGGQIAWAVRKNTPKLTAEVNAFMATHRIGTEFGDGLRSQYYNDGRIVKNALAPEHAKLLRDLMVYFKEYGDQFRIDPYILAAQGFQESAFDQTLRMKSGAVGVMQMKPSTAREELGIPDIVSSSLLKNLARAKEW